jgi:GntR family transcriptional regulator/MocR family aminotransferase
LYDSYRSAILRGDLRPGQIVPSTRGLALELEISRMPVLTAYAQLIAEGYFETRVGLGTLISEALPSQRTSTARASQPRPQKGVSSVRAVSSRGSAAAQPFRPPWITGRSAFAIGEVALDHFPYRAWSSLLARNARNGSAIGTYGDAMGSKALREAIAEYLRTSRAVKCDAGQIMIVNGSQHGVEITARALLDPGNAVWIEEPGYRLTRDALEMAGCRLVPVPVDREGIDVKQGVQLCRNPRAVFVTPSHQFPLGMTMSLSRRLELLTWAAKEGAWIVEDDYDGEFRYDSKPLSSLQGLDSNARVIYIGTFSKVLFPALRLGYVVMPPDLVPHFAAVRRAGDLGSAALEQAVVADFMRDGHFSRHIRKMRLLYRERRSALVEALQHELGDTAAIVGSEAGLHLVLLPNGMKNDIEMARAAASQRVWLWPLSPCYCKHPGSQGFVLGFANTPVDQIRRGAKKLAPLLATSK